ncbi:hypothetical protein [Arthrobacter sp. BPSS-3]|uniref:hypothetical protein n=1 Tax=Arthrobacter sp. BPSS-3 TaxID=3366580 RepID=UPI0037DC0C7D
MNLQELILHRKGDRSYPQLATAAGGAVTSRTLQSITKDGFTRFPDAATLTGIAKALGLQARDVVLAAATTLGIDVDDVCSTDAIHPGAREIDDLGSTDPVRPGTPEPEEQIYYWRNHAEHYKARAMVATATATGNRGGHAHARR